MEFLPYFIDVMKLKIEFMVLLFIIMDLFIMVVKHYMA